MNPKPEREEPPSRPEPETTEPLCEICWIALDLGRASVEGRSCLRLAVRVLGSEEVCCLVCGTGTTSGIFVRVQAKLAELLGTETPID
jgi:hypothetical protein